MSVFTIEPNGDATLRLGPSGTLNNISYDGIGPSARNEHDEIVVGAGWWTSS